jgi:hypothetical protein
MIVRASPMQENVFSDLLALIVFCSSFNIIHETLNVCNVWPQACEDSMGENVNSH